MSADGSTFETLELTVEIASAYISKNSVPSSDVSKLIVDLHAALDRLVRNEKDVVVDPPKPAISARRSVTNEFIVCLEDGKKFKSLKRHLRTHYNLSPEAYREKWGLPADYPMVAPAYAKARSQLAKEMGLGQQRRRT